MSSFRKKCLDLLASLDPRASYGHARPPKLVLVGAGPGAADLITLRGLNAIRNADVILYDALVNTELLNEAGENTELLFVGKRAGRHSLKQQEINQLIVDRAKDHGTIVRLKGGDPFVFGRGYEELEYAVSHGLEVEVIPGVSSAFSVPALAGIPVTHRGYSRSVRIITATTESGELHQELVQAIDTADTLIVFMGFGFLNEIVNFFKANAQSETPIAVIQSGSTAEERIVIGTMEDIIDKANEAEIGPPALIVIGNVVSLHPQFEKVFTSRRSRNHATAWQAPRASIGTYPQSKHYV